MNVLITGAAGFIGYHLCNYLISNNISVYGIDNLNDYYDVKLKEDRLENLKTNSNYNLFKFKRIDIADHSSLHKLFSQNTFSHVVNLAAQAGVRYSLEEPAKYITSNCSGFLNILECCRNFKIKHLIYASSSSVYGESSSEILKTINSADHPLSLYAATKRSNELMAHSYSHLFNIPTTGLRFFTVYGPWGRPDMAPFLFSKAIINGSPINVFNNGEMERDFTYVDDIVKSIYLLLEKIPIASSNYDLPNSSKAKFKIYNIGNSSPTNLLKFIEVIENKIEKPAIKNFLPMQAGDVKKTYADVEDLYNLIQFRPNTTLETGISTFINWYKQYYKV